jgi:CRISPR-associated protein Csb1
MSQPLTLAGLQQAIRSASAIRRRATLQPAGGDGEKVFPSTYEGGNYATEERVVDGEKRPCVILDSVASQANRMELALLEAETSKSISIPVVEVDFAKAGLPDVGTITALEAPHRIADAILRDSMLEGKRFRETDIGKSFTDANAQNATALFQFCPTALVFGMWDSTGPKGGMGTKIQRAVRSEIVGVGVVTGTRTSSRLDPLQISIGAGPIYKQGASWTLKEDEADKEKGKAVKLGKDGKPSEANHGNVTPSIDEGKGGVTLSHALQITVLSLPALRRLRFPVKGQEPGPVNEAARTVLAAVALCGAILSIEQGCDLRSRCHLVPDVDHPATWEILDANGQPIPFTLSGADAAKLLGEAIDKAKSLGLPWAGGRTTLTPSPQLAALVKKSRDLAMQSTTAEE